MKILVGILCTFFLAGTAFAQSDITVWGEDFRDKSGLAVMIHMKAADTSICFKDVKIKTNIGEDSMQSFGCDADNLENYFMVYPGEDDDITKLQIQKLTGTDVSGNTVNFANLLKPQYSPDETTARIDIAIENPAPIAERSRLGIFGINLSSTYELNDGVRKMFHLESERNMKSFYQDKSENGAELFSLLKNMAEQSILPFPKDRLNFLSFRKMEFMRVGLYGGNSFIRMTPDRKIVCIQYSFPTNISIENILPDIQSKFGEYQNIEKRTSVKDEQYVYYVWNDGLSYAVLSGMKKKEQITVSKIYFIDIAAIQRLEQEMLGQVNKQDEARQNRAKDAFK